MQTEPWTYKNLHDYLDDLFKNKDPLDDEIIQAKKMYWRSYNTRLKQIQRKKKKEITIGLKQEELKQLHRKLEHNQSISNYIKNLLEVHLQGNESVNYSQKKELTQIEQHLFILIDYLESLIYQRRFVDNNQIGKLELYILQLQQMLETHF